ncbi:hypothetical protein DNTS_006518 [Danionella cerebrum]|nr:hypothetical protein DNTS_006518 [Danionella translucida]
MDLERRGGRGDRMGRYGKESGDYDFRDVDYRSYAQQNGLGLSGGLTNSNQLEHDSSFKGTADFTSGNVSDTPLEHKLKVGTVSDQLVKTLSGQNRRFQQEDKDSGPEPEIHVERINMQKFGFSLGEQTPAQFEENEDHLSGQVRGWHNSQSSSSAEWRAEQEKRIKHLGFIQAFPDHLRSPEDNPRESCLQLSSEMNQEESEGHDQDYRADSEAGQKPSNVVMLRMLPFNATYNEIRALLNEQGVQPKEVRLMRNKSSGQSRGFAFVEFNHLQEASHWMETNQRVLTILGQRVSMHYKDLKPRANEDWLCNKCGVQNFKRREKCFKCGVPKSEAELKLPVVPKSLSLGQMKDHSQGLLPLPAIYQVAAPLLCLNATAKASEVANDTLILRNLAPHSTLEAILSALAPFATLSPSNIRLIKDKQTQLNRGFAFLQLTTIVEASQLLQILQSLQPPLSIDGKGISVEFAKGFKRDALPSDATRASVATVASTAIAAAQWAVSQTVQATKAGFNADPGEALLRGETLVPLFRHEEAQMAGRAETQPFKFPVSTVLTSHSSFNAADGGDKAVNSMLKLMASQSQPSNTQANQALVEIIGKPQPAPSNQLATPGTALECQHYPDPDVSTYQYDESSGYYYDPFTGLYYDPNSQYYYNPHTQQYMYWDGEKHTYVPACKTPGDTSDPAAGDLSGTPNSSKDKRDRPKSKSAQQIAKDMERWAKSMNRQKENGRSSSLSSSSRLGQGRGDDTRESASADAGYAVLEMKGALLERPQILSEQIRQPQERHGISPSHALLPSASAGVVESVGEMDDHNERLSDWFKLACLLCRRQFPSREALIRHQQLSDLHRQNLEQRRARQMQSNSKEQTNTELMYRERAGVLQQPEAKKRRFSPV